MPPTHTVAYNPTWRAPEELEKQNWPELAAPKTTGSQPSGGSTNAGQAYKNSAEKDFCKSNSETRKIKKSIKAARVQTKTPISRHRAPQDDVDELEAMCVRDMEHEKAGILRRNIRSLLSDEHHCLNVRYMQADR